ncbi:MAG TPA: hypothetical protein ENJ00_00660 [Phycisphaerales bacterium]|nr:hypothetical protein [Phycisphaerales bacterium]
MDSNLYKRVEEVICRVLAAPESDRERLLTELTASDEELDREVRSLLANLSNTDESHPLSDQRLRAQRQRLDRFIDEPEQASSRHVERIGDYLICGILGEGGMGVVYKALQARPARETALKVIDAIRADDEISKRFKAEAEIQGQLQHPGIVQIYEAGLARIGHTDRPFIAMELVNGDSLRDYADRAGLDTAGKLDLLAKVADAIGYAHSKGVVHRDLKPENILVREDGQPKVLDFGIARVTSDATLAATTMTRDGQLLGTLAFMAPEQFTGDEITPATDVYALGVVAFELIAGKPPVDLGGLSITAAMRLVDQHDSPKLRSVAPDVDRDVETIVSKCLRREPENRYQNASELATDLRSLLADRPITARPPDTMYLTKKYIKRNRIFVGGMVATMVTLTAGIVVASVFAVGQRNARLLADANEREARKQQAALVGSEFQKAADMSASGDVFGAIEVLESIPNWLRGWGWELLAAGLPRWMPGDHEFGGISDVYSGATDDLQGGEQEVASMNATHVLTIAGRKLQQWDPLSGNIETLYPDSSFDAIEYDLSGKPERIAVDLSGDYKSAVGERRLLNTSTRLLGPLPEFLQPNRNTNTIYNAQFHAATWRHPRDNIENDEQDRTVYFWDEAHGTQSFLRPYKIESSYIKHKSEDQNQYVLLTFGFDESGREITEVFIFDSGACEVVATTGILKPTPVLCVVPSRGEVAISSYIVGYDVLPSTMIEILDLNTLEHNRSLGVNGAPVAYLPGHDAFVVETSDKINTLVSAEDGRVLQQYAPDHPKDKRVLRMHGNAPMLDESFLLAAGPRPYRPVLFDTDEPENGLEAGFHSRPSTGDTYHLALSPGGGLLASYHPYANQLCLLDARSGERLWSTTPGSDSHISKARAQVYFTNDATLVASTASLERDKPTMLRLAIATGEAVRPPRKEIVKYFPVLDFKELAPNQMLSSGAAVNPSGDGFILNNRALEGRLIFIDRFLSVTTDNEMSTADGFGISPDGKHIAIASTGAVEIFDLESRELVAKPVIDNNRLLCAAYSPDGKTLAIGTHDGRIMIIETEFYTKLFEFVATPEAQLSEKYKYVYMLAWSKDSKTLYSSHAGGYVLSWGTTRPYEQRQLRARQTAADERVTALLNEHLAAGLSAQEAGDALLGDPSLSPEERAAAEVALVRRWPSAEEE